MSIVVIGSVFVDIKGYPLIVLYADPPVQKENGIFSRSGRRPTCGDPLNEE